MQADRYTLALDFPPGHRATASGGGGHDRITLTLPQWSLDLKVSSDDAAVPPALHYDGLAHDYACGGYTYYYSRPRMAATGTLTLDGTALDVSGTVWFDRQYGDLNAVVHRGWQWFAIEMNDGRNVMLFDILDLPGEAYGAVMQGTSYPRPDRIGVLGRGARALDQPAHRHRLSLQVEGDLRRRVVHRHAAHRGSGVPRAAAV